MAATEQVASVVASSMDDMLNSEGPTVQMCILQPDGTVSEKTFDSTPAKNHLMELMGGQVTILGTYHQNGVVLLKLREPKEDTPKNTHVLHAPFDDLKVSGPIALVRMDMNTVRHYPKILQNLNLKNL